jgi:hypothetical protein
MRLSEAKKLRFGQEITAWGAPCRFSHLEVENEDPEKHERNTIHFTDHDNYPDGSGYTQLFYVMATKHNKIVLPSLQPCPFCQCEMRILKDNSNSYKPFGSHGDECVLEGIEIKFSSPTHLASNWNTRVPATLPTKKTVPTLMVNISLIKLPSYADTEYPQSRIDGMIHEINTHGWPDGLILPILPLEDTKYYAHGVYDWFTAAQQSSIIEIPCAIY